VLEEFNKPHHGVSPYIAKCRSKPDDIDEVPAFDFRREFVGETTLGDFFKQTGMDSLYARNNI
jgi:hypothetical protein